MNGEEEVPGPPLNLRSFTLATERTGQGRQRARLILVITLCIKYIIAHSLDTTKIHLKVNFKNKTKNTESHSVSLTMAVWRLTVAHPLQEILEGFCQFAGLKKNHIRVFIPLNSEETVS